MAGMQGTVDMHMRPRSFGRFSETKRGVTETVSGVTVLPAGQGGVGCNHLEHGRLHHRDAVGEKREGEGDDLNECFVALDRV